MRNAKRSSTIGGAKAAARCRRASRDRGFTLIEMVTSVTVMVIVLSAAWLLLNASNDNLNRIDFGGQASEMNRAALAQFETDLGHAMQRPDGLSPVLDNSPRRCAMLVDTNNDGFAELVVWSADDTQNVLQRSVTQALAPSLTLGSEADFASGNSTTTVEVTGLATAAESGSPALFTYQDDASSPDATLTADIGLITIHLRNGMPTRTQNVVDRTASFRVMAQVINGYN
jgi:prepilin-type N-terminal cleavage/methylation domain-containing protein